MWHTALKLFVLQLIQYAVVSVAYRALAQANTRVCVSIDFFYALLSYAILRRVATAPETWVNQLSYAAGGATGSALGIWLSLSLLGR